MSPDFYIYDDGYDISEVYATITLYKELNPQEQSDWNEDDQTKPTYIKNKPDLNNYVLKNEFNSFSSEIDNQFQSTALVIEELHENSVSSSTSGLKIEVVSALPATPDANTIYICTGNS